MITTAQLIEITKSNKHKLFVGAQVVLGSIEHHVACVPTYNIRAIGQINKTNTGSVDVRVLIDEDSKQQGREYRFKALKYSLALSAKNCYSHLYLLPEGVTMDEIRHALQNSAKLAAEALAAANAAKKIEAEAKAKRRAEYIAKFWETDGKRIFDSRQEVLLQNGTKFSVFQHFPATITNDAGEKWIPEPRIVMVVIQQIFNMYDYDFKREGREQNMVTQISRGGLEIHHREGQSPSHSFWSGSSYTLPLTNWEAEFIYNEFAC